MEQPNNQYYKELSHSISNYWDIIRKSAWEGEPYRHVILEIEDILKDENQILIDIEKAGNIPDHGPLNQIISTHNHNYAWLERTLNERSEFVNWWKRFIETEFNSLKSSVNESRKLVFLAHGTAMLTSLTALGAIQTTNYVPSFLSVAIGGLIGFSCAIIGQIIWLEKYGSVIAQLHSDFKTTRKIKRFQSYGRYLQKRWSKEVIWSIRFTYISVSIFPLYSIIAILLAANSK